MPFIDETDLMNIAASRLDNIPECGVATHEL